MKQRWTLALMGAWLMGTIAVATVAAENFYTIDRLLAARSNPAFAQLVDRLGAAEARELLRYLSSELNRLYFQIWDYTQIAIGVAVVLLLRNTAPVRARYGAAAMLAIAGVLHLITPMIVRVGRGLDFVPRDPQPPAMQLFWILHGGYTTLSLIQLAVGAAVTVAIARAVRQDAIVTSL